MQKNTYFNLPSIRNLAPAQKELRYQRYMKRVTARSRQRAVVRAESNQNNQQNKPVKMNKQSKPQLSQVKLSQCLLDYARASIDPFDVIVKNPCIPDGVCIPSFKFNAACNGQLSVGTSGVALIAFNPWIMFSGDNSSGGGYIGNPIAVTTSTYDHTDIRITDAERIAGKLETANSNSYLRLGAPPPSVASVPMRLVAAGVEIMYTGTTLNQSGAITTIQAPGLESWGTAVTFNALRNIPSSRTCSVSKSARCYVSYYPTNEQVLAYSKYSDYFPTTKALPEGAYHPLLIAINGGQPGETFQFKAIAYFEAQLYGMDVTPSHSDPVGFGAFQSARAKHVSTEDAGKDLIDILKDTGKVILKSVSGIFPVAGGAIGAAFGQPEVGAAAGKAAESALDFILADKPRVI